MQDLDKAQIGQVAVERRGGAAAILEDRMDRELHGNAAGVADPFTHPGGELDVDPVAGRQVAARLGDADDRPA